jgi:hypothetical protein
MVWELVFMLVVLKIPLVYLCMVVWWAIRNEPRDEEPTVGVRVTDTPSPHPGWTRPQRDGRDPGGRRGDRSRVAGRPARTRAEVGR